MRLYGASSHPRNTPLPIIRSCLFVKDPGAKKLGSQAMHTLQPEPALMAGALRWTWKNRSVATKNSWCVSVCVCVSRAVAWIVCRGHCWLACSVSIVHFHVGSKALWAAEAGGAVMDLCLPISPTVLSGHLHGWVHRACTNSTHTHTHTPPPFPTAIHPPLCGESARRRPPPRRA